MPSGKLVLCFGEALWDVFPDEMRPGGAPLNVAYHLSKLGYRAAPVTALGRDARGEQLLDQMKAWGLETAFVTFIDDLPTGTVMVGLNGQGQPSYEIQTGVAWEQINIGRDVHNLASTAAAVVFGTLAIGGSYNRGQLSTLLETAKDALKVYDVNLRPPNTPAETVWDAAGNADIIKLTTDELQALLSDKTGDVENMARQLAERTGSAKICVTAAEKGAWLLDGETWLNATGQKVDVVDAVGAGDAFISGLIDGLLSGLEPKQALDNGTRMGGLIVGRQGATPPYDDSDLRSLGIR